MKEGILIRASTGIFPALFRALDRLLPDFDRAGSEEALRKARFVYVGIILLILNDLAFGVLGLALGDRVLPWIVLGTGALAGFAPVLHRLTGSARAAAAWIAAIGTVMLVAVSLLSGGMHATSRVWFAALAVFILVTQGTALAVAWTGLIALECAALWWLTARGVELPDYENPAAKAVSWVLSFPASLLLVISMLHGFFEAHRRAIRNLDAQAGELRRQARELGMAMEKAEAASNARREFIATVSHEIRTPLNGILGVAQLMDGTPLTAQQRGWLEALRMSAEGLMAIVSDILDFSKIESGRLRVRNEAFDVKSLCEGCLSVFAGITRSKEVDLRLEIAAGTPSWALGDAVRIRQILFNLVGNAVKFTDRGEVVLEAAPVPDRAGWMRFSVRDTGIGMNDAFLRDLFQPYTQADSSASRRYGGTGLGLAICSRLAGLMGGTIAAKSRPGQGSTFAVDLPLTEAAPPAEPASLPEPEAPAAALIGKRVLLVEDNAVNRMVILAMLRQAGVESEAAEDGSEAVALWREGRFDLLLMDCQMPGMDGYQAARMIRQEEAQSGTGRRIPIVAVTAHAMEEERARCLEAGMDDCLTKPVKAATLRACLLARLA